MAVTYLEVRAMNIVAQPSLFDFKACSKCSQVKPLTQFRLHNKATGKRHPDCNECHKLHQREYAVKYPHKIAEFKARKKVKEQERLPQRYCRECSVPVGRRKMLCEACRKRIERARDLKDLRAKKKRMRAEQPEIYRARNQTEKTRRRIMELLDPARRERRLALYRKHNDKRRESEGRQPTGRRPRHFKTLRVREGHFTCEQWMQLVDHYEGRCLRCGKHFGILNLEVDHIIPITKYPSVDNSIENIQPLCHDCNQWKKTKVVDYRPDKSCLLPSKNPEM
jgi:5-methylcytosine-specific restriction endonuclease McrA